ncbi:hypothetical protein FOZ62_009263, partial [Perkinsus olseni]
HFQGNGDDERLEIIAEVGQVLLEDSEKYADKKSMLEELADLEPIIGGHEAVDEFVDYLLSVRQSVSGSAPAEESGETAAAGGGTAKGLSGINTVDTEVDRVVFIEGYDNGNLVVHMAYATRFGIFSATLRNLACRSHFADYEDLKNAVVGAEVAGTAKRCQGGVDAVPVNNAVKGRTSQGKVTLVPRRGQNSVG